MKLNNSISLLFGFLLAAESASALNATFYGLYFAYSADEAVPVVFCFDQLVDMHEQSARKHPKWSIELNYARSGKHAIPSAKFETLNALVGRDIMASDGDSKNGVSDIPVVSQLEFTGNIDPLEEQGNKAYCWGAVVDLEALELKNESYRWVLGRKRYVIDRKSLAVRWFRQSFKSQQFPSSVPKFTLTGDEFSQQDKLIGGRVSMPDSRPNWMQRTKAFVKRKLLSRKKTLSASPLVNAFHSMPTVPRSLIEAAMFGNIEATIRFLQEGADVNALEGMDYSALMVAVSNGETEIAKVLIEAGADVNMKDKYGHTALLRAVIRNHPKLVQMLLTAGADLSDSGEMFGETAQEIALNRGYKEITQILNQAATE